MNSFEYQLLQTGLQNPTAGILAKSTFVTARSAIPVILVPNGTVATNGVVTLGTALPLVYTNAWVRLPAGAVVGGLAGLYYVVFSSTTVGQVYTNFADTATAFTPNVPATLVAAVGSNAAYTQVTGADVTLVNVTVPGNQIGQDGSLLVTTLQSNNNSAGVKTLTAKLAGNAFMVNAVTTSLALESEKRVTNRGVVNAQLAHADMAFGTASSVAPTQMAVDTSASQSVAFTGKIAVATDYLVLERFVTEVRPS